MAKEISNKKKLEETDYEALSALLDFYSDRAVAHASFVVACVFGLFTVLSLLRGVDLFLKVAYSFIYWVLWSAGIYSLLNFRSFAIEAERVRRFILKHKWSLLVTRLTEETKEEEIVKRPNAVYRCILKLFSDFKLSDKKIDTMIALYFVFIGILPWAITVIS